MLNGWRAFGIGQAVFFEGILGTPERVMSKQIEYFDRTTQCGVCEDGLVWKIPLENVYCQDIYDMTWEVLVLLESPL